MTDEVSCGDSPHKLLPGLLTFLREMKVGRMVKIFAPLEVL